jgi:hypothetical protein
MGFFRNPPIDGDKKALYRKQVGGRCLPRIFISSTAPVFISTFYQTINRLGGNLCVNAAPDFLIFRFGLAASARRIDSTTFFSILLTRDLLPINYKVLFDVATFFYYVTLGNWLLCADGRR